MRLWPEPFSLIVPTGNFLGIHVYSHVSRTFQSAGSWYSVDFLRRSGVDGVRILLHTLQYTRTTGLCDHFLAYPSVFFGMVILQTTTLAESPLFE